MLDWMRAVQEYMVKLLGRYGEFVKRDLPGSPAPVPEANGTGPRIRHQDDGYIRPVPTSVHKLLRPRSPA